MARDHQLPTYKLLRRGKRHDYFTSAFPGLKKAQASLFLSVRTAPIIGLYRVTGPHATLGYSDRSTGMLNDSSDGTGIVAGLWREQYHSLRSSLSPFR